MGAQACAKINTSGGNLLERKNISYWDIFAKWDKMGFVIISYDVIVSV
jgi:hypothetical protein